MGSRKKWTQERINLYTEHRNISCLADIDHVQQPSITPVLWKCNVCTYQWKARLDNIIGKLSGCPSCAGNIAYTTKTLQEKLKQQNRFDLILVELYANLPGTRKAKFRCVECANCWIASIHNVLKFRYGCPDCNSNLSKPVVDQDGNRFHSKLEYYFWVQVHKRSLLLPILRQHRYTDTRRLTCDFMFPTIHTWIEISGTHLLKREKYASTIQTKQQMIIDRKETFVVLTSFTEIDHFLSQLSDAHTI